MKPSKLTDTITRLGAALEKDAGQALIVCSTTTLGYALFREHGLQVIPDESHEIDTGGACLLVVTPRSDVMSGLLLRIKAAAQSGSARAAGISFYPKLAELLKARRASQAKGWENSAMKDVVSLAIGHFSKTSARDSIDTQSRRLIDPFTGQERDVPESQNPEDFGGWGDENPMSHLEQAHYSLRRRLEIRENLHSQGESRGAVAIIICGMAGTVAGKLWLPLVARTTRLTPNLVRRIVAKLVALKYDPSYAQAVLQELLARSSTRKRR
jgi:hypothetical protein